jgi:hypothetical protein
MGRGLALVGLLCVGTVACSTASEELPTQNRPSDAELIPDAPLANPNPTPEATPLPPAPGGGGGVGGGTSSGSCGSPAPPPLSRIKVSVLHRQPARRTLNATPLVGPDGAYCQSIGYADGRLFCPVRTEGHPERAACEALQVGQARDTGRTGPSWTADGRPCRGRTGGTSCSNHPDNQFLVIAFGQGTFEACTSGGVCGRYQDP